MTRAALRRPRENRYEPRERGFNHAGRVKSEIKLKHLRVIESSV